MFKLQNIFAEFQRVTGVAMRVFLVGVLIGLVLQFFHADGVKIFLGISLIQKVWSLVGVALIGLVPLSVWMTWLVVKHCAQSKPVHKRELLDYEYISDQAQTWGLLGTIVALVMAGTAMAVKVSSGSSVDTIMGIFPMVAQALVSTVVGLIINAVARTAHHLVDRQNA